MGGRCGLCDEPSFAEQVQYGSVGNRLPFTRIGRCGSEFSSPKDTLRESEGQHGYVGI